MHTLVALLLAAAALCAIAHSSGNLVGPSPVPMGAQDGIEHQPPPPNPLAPPTNYNEFFLGPLMKKYASKQRQVYPKALSGDEWLDKEIKRIGSMGDERSHRRYGSIPNDWIVEDPYIRRIFAGTVIRRDPFEKQESSGEESEEEETMEHAAVLSISKPPLEKSSSDYNHQTNYPKVLTAKQLEDIRKKFALTPQDEGYYDYDNESKTDFSSLENSDSSDGAQEGGTPVAGALLEPQRQTRQNPILSKTKNLVAGDLDKLRARLAFKDGYSMPVSLLPTNLRWLEVDPINDNEERSHEEAAVKSSEVDVAGQSPGNPPSSLFGVAVLAAIGAVIALTVFILLIGWYKLSKKAKAAADVDYPAYGVTGPNVDNSGDRKLAHSAHMYHYQHQKQQIIAMERSCVDHNGGSVSDPESEEENEEGDYTVYECPGFATTGAMEVRNPMFNDEPTPSTPGPCEVVPLQPKAE